MKVKIFLLLLFLIVLFALLRIKKLEKNNIILKLQPSLEYFSNDDDSCNQLEGMNSKLSTLEFRGSFKDCFRKYEILFFYVLR